MHSTTYNEKLFAMWGGFLMSTDISIFIFSMVYVYNGFNGYEGFQFPILVALLLGYTVFGCMCGYCIYKAELKD